jgi:hypothetical protein
MKPQPKRADWRKTNPGYKPSPTQRNPDGSISQDGGVLADQLNSLREWYRLAKVKSYCRGE